ncbi:hypothetical protein BJV77DRAFT_1009875 [Russula vinacea]|nr:hypothetical protein BJV77DRAFT_1009875 [Russula vinacea]
MTTPMSLLDWLPTELIIAIATLLDAPSLACLESTCKTLRDLVDKTPALKYVLALAVRGLCDGPPSTVTAARRLQLLEDYDEAWRTFSWSQYLVLDLRTFEAPYVSGNTLVIRETRDLTRSFIMQSIPSRLRGVPGRQWRIDFDFWVQIFVLDATQDLLVVVPNHDPNNVLLYQLSTGQPHPLSASGGVLRVEQPRRPCLGISKHEVSGDFLGMITKSYTHFDDRLSIWNWKTGIVYINMPILVGSYHEAVFSFLDDRHFIIPSIASERPNEIALDTFQFHHPHHHGQQQHISARGGACPGHFYADASKREFGIEFEATSKSTDAMVVVHELLVPLRALMAIAPKHTPLPCRPVSVDYEPCLGRRLAYAVRVTEEHPYKVSVDLLPPALRDVGAHLRFAICCGALLVFEVCLGGMYSFVVKWC